MKFLIVIFILFLPQTSFSETYHSESYVISVISTCEEGNVTCDAVQFEMKEIKSGNVSQQIGSTVHSLCKDAVTPCRFLGYEFSIDDRHYFLSEIGTLQITNSQGEHIISESGEWQYE